MKRFIWLSFLIPTLFMTCLTLGAVIQHFSDQDRAERQAQYLASFSVTVKGVTQ